MEKDIGKINKNDTTDVVIRVDDFGGRTGVTIREFVTSDRYTGFTKSGVRILAADFPKFREMLNSVTDEDLKEPEQPAEEGQPSPGQETLTEEPKKEVAEEPAKEEAKENLPDY